MWSGDSYSSGEEMKIQTPHYNWQSYKFGTISLCMIMKDEEKRLARCLNSVRKLVDEIIIVDTGSSDNSIEIAKSYGAQVLIDPWQDDFSRPRNIGIKQARGDYIFIMDADEMISESSHNDLKWLTRIEQIKAFWLTTLNYGAFQNEWNYRTLETGKDPLGVYRGYIPSTKTRFFKNGLGIYFEGCYHELVDYYLTRKKIAVAKTEIPIHHWAHEINQPTAQKKKDFYLNLALKKVREWPEHSQARWELGVTQMIYGDREGASRTIAKALDLGYTKPEQHFALSRCLYFLGQKEKSNFAYEKGLCQLYPTLTHIDTDSKSLAALTKGM